MQSGGTASTTFFFHSFGGFPITLGGSHWRTDRSELKLAHKWQPNEPLTMSDFFHGSYLRQGGLSVGSLSLLNLDSVSLVRLSLGIAHAA